jgi:hypothetical protein
LTSRPKLHHPELALGLGRQRRCILATDRRLFARGKEDSTAVSDRHVEFAGIPSGSGLVRRVELV